MLIKTSVPLLPLLYSFNVFPMHTLSVFVSPLLELYDMYFLIIFHQHYLNQDIGEIFSIF